MTASASALARPVRRARFYSASACEFVIAMLACPMNSLSAFTFTPAAFISDANVCRASCRPIGWSCFLFFASSAAFHARCVRLWLVVAALGPEFVRGELGCRRVDDRDRPLGRVRLAGADVAFLIVAAARDALPVGARRRCSSVIVSPELSRQSRPQLQSLLREADVEACSAALC
jgi:hypothetical protein